MIFEFSREFNRPETVDVENNQSMFEAFLNAHAWGKHIVVLPKQLTAELKNHKQAFSRRQYAALVDIEENLSEYRGMAKTINMSVLIVPDCCPEVAEAGRHYVVVKLAGVSHVDMLDKPQLLVENGERDGDFYGRLAEVLRKDIGVSRRFRIEAVSGGGTGIAGEYKRLAKAYRPILCIADSDLKSPDGSYGDTTKNLIKATGGEFHKLIWVHILDVREPENLIPLECIDDLYFDNKEMGKDIAKLYQIRQLEAKLERGREILRFADLKEGVTTSDIASMKNVEDRDFYVRAWKLVDPERGLYDFNTENLVIVPAVSDKLLENFNAVLVRPDRQRRFAGCLRRSYVYEDAIDLARILTGIFAHPNEIRV